MVKKFNFGATMALFVCERVLSSHTMNECFRSLSFKVACTWCQLVTDDITELIVLRLDWIGILHKISLADSR